MKNKLKFKIELNKELGNFKRAEELQNKLNKLTEINERTKKIAADLQRK